MQLIRFPSPETLASAYAEAEWQDYVDEEAGQRATARAVLERIEPLSAPGRLLDVGCWVGFLLDEARAAGWDGVGIEPSHFASAFARERLGLDIRTGELWEVDLPPASFDAVVLGDLIEHLPDPSRALDRIRLLTAPGGVLHLTLPDAGSRLAPIMGRRWWSVIPTHVQYFTRASLIRLLLRHGWQVLTVETAPKAFTVRYYLSRTEGYSPGIARMLVRTAERLRLAERVWAPDFRDRMAVVARRRP